MTYYIIRNNTDPTEGRGGEYTFPICELYTTAERVGKGQYVQGMDCPIFEIESTIVDGKEYFEKQYVPFYPALLEDKEKEMIRIQNEIKKQRKLEVFKKMKELGITDEEISMIKMNVDDSFNLKDYDVSYPDINIDTFEFGVGVYVKEWEFENVDEV